MGCSTLEAGNQQLVAVPARTDVRWFSSSRGHLVVKIEKKKFYILSFFFLMFGLNFGSFYSIYI
jgi:hypothetical protein